MPSEIVAETFPLRPQGKYNLRIWSDFTLPVVRAVNYGIESIRYVGPKIWESIPANIKEVDTIDVLNQVLRKGNLNVIHVDFVKPTYNKEDTCRLNGDCCCERREVQIRKDGMTIKRRNYL